MRAAIGKHRLTAAFDQARDIVKRDFPVEEGRDGDFIRRIEHGRRAMPGPQRVERDSQRRKPAEVRPLEGQLTDGGEIEAARLRLQPVRI